MENQRLFPKTFFVAVLISSWTGAVGQRKVDPIDSSPYNYAILRFYNSGFSKNLSVTYSDSVTVDLQSQLAKRNKKNKKSFSNLDVMSGISYLDSQGYELVSSLGYGDLGHGYVKEYIFRIKKIDR